MFGKWRKRAKFLWKLLDNISLIERFNQEDEAFFRSLVKKECGRRLDVAISDGWRLFWKRKVPEYNMPDD